MPNAVIVKGFEAAQDAVSIAFGGDPAHSQGGFAKVRMRYDFRGRAEDDIAGFVHLKNEEIVCPDELAGRGPKLLVIRSSLGEHHVQTDRFRPLCRQFLDQKAVNVPRPIKSELESCIEVSAAKVLDCFITDENEPEIRSGLIVQLTRLAHAPVVSD